MDLPLVLYHAECYDGHTAAWAFLKLRHGAEFLPVYFGQPPPPVGGREVWILDFSYPREVLIRMHDEAASLQVLDHHKTAQEDLESLPYCTFDMGRSGAGITWDMLSTLGGECRECGARQIHSYGCPKARPWLVDFVEDRDLWTMKLPETESVNAWIHAQPMTFEAWDRLARLPLGEAVRGGACVRQYVREYGVMARAQARNEEVAGYTVPTMNLPYMDCSEHVGRLLEESPYAHFAVGYFRRRDGRWQFSLRSRKDFDVSEVAKKFGGGGHAQAAGFTTARLPWDHSP